MSELSTDKRPAASLCVCFAARRSVVRVFKKRKVSKCLSVSLVPLPAFDDVIQGQAILHGIKAFSAPTVQLKLMIVFVCLTKHSKTELRLVIR